MTTLNFEHLKTYHLNTDSTEIAKPEDSYTVRFCMHTMHTFAPVIDKLSKAFLQAQLDYQDGYLDKPRKICVFIPKNLLNYKMKKEDAETSLERIYWFIENFKKPTCGVIVSFYASENHDHDIDSHWCLSNLWPLEKTWQGQNSNYVTVHLPEPTSNVIWNKQNFETIWKYIKLLIRSKGLDIKFITYATSYKEAHELMINSKLHISYVGASYIFSGITKTPTIGIGVKRKKNPDIHDIVHGLPFYYDGYPKNIFGLGPMQEDRVMQIDDNMKVYNDFVHHLIDTDETSEAIEYINKILSNDYSPFEKPHKPDVQIATMPWFHLCIDNFLPQDEFEKLRQEALEVPVKENEVARKLFDYDPTPQIKNLIQTFVKASENYDVNMRQCRISNLKKFIHYAITPEHFDHKMHVEAEFKIMSAVLYLGPEENIGTRLYENENGDGALEVEWKPNRLFVFCGNNKTWHDYASTSTRYTYNYFLVDPDIVQNEEYKKNLI